MKEKVLWILKKIVELIVQLIILSGGLYLFLYVMTILKGVINK